MSFDFKTLYFPYEKVRPYQDALILNINASIENRKNLIAHAPTGLGKTSASLSPALSQALKNNLTVFYLTPRHTQHKMVIDTVSDICKSHGLNVLVTDLLGRQAMCPLDAAKELSSGDFTEYCTNMKKDGKCPYYKNTKKTELTSNAKELLNKLISKSPIHSQELIASCIENNVCPYEMSLELVKKSKVIVCDYYYIFSESIREQFLSKTGKVLEDSVLIIDEAHNLPDRIRDLMTYSLSTFSLKASIKELQFNGYDKEADFIVGVMQAVNELTSKGKEGTLTKDDLINKIIKITGITDYNETIEEVYAAGHVIREANKKSYSMSVARFLEVWAIDSKDRLRVYHNDTSKKGSEFTQVTYHCINPGEYTEQIFNEAHSSILMSGTLIPTKMYSEVLGLKDATALELKSPFPQENRMTLIVPETTTRFTRRGSEEYEKIAGRISSMLSSLKVNTAVFFPSYMLLNQVLDRVKTDKKIITEAPGLSKEERETMLNSFRMSKGNVLFAVVSGSFGEGIDLPGSALEAIIIVGVPLPVPDLYTKAVIDYYERRYGKGWEYGYTIPALTKVIQSAGRCIRRDSDRGVIVLLDERYAWDTYRKCIPPEWIVRVTKTPEIEINNFFC